MKIDDVKAVVDGVDFYARTLEEKWGVERLRLLVDPDLRAKFDAQRQLFNDALFGNKAKPIIEHAEAMMRGWRALDEAARVSGAEPLKSEVWEVRMPSGKVCALVRTNDEAHHVCTDDRYVEVWTIGEVGRLIEGPWRDIGKVKQVFPGALVCSLTEGEPNDDIPF